jgi:hypothetical protein
MPAPPVVCRSCGYKGQGHPRGIVIENSTDITLGGGTVPCPRCGRPADIVPGTYDFVGDVIRLVRSADLSAEQVAALAAVLTEAQDRGEVPDPADVTQAHPEFAAIIQALTEATKDQKRRDNWVQALVVLLTILASYLISEREMQQAERQHQESQRQASTRTLSDEDAERLGAEFARKFKSVIGSTPPQTKSKQRRRPPKTYGKNKKHRKR